MSRVLRFLVPVDVEIEIVVVEDDNEKDLEDLAEEIINSLSAYGSTLPKGDGGTVVSITRIDSQDIFGISEEDDDD